MSPRIQRLNMSWRLRDDARGEIYFDDSDLFTGFASKIQSEGARKIVRETTIDHEIGVYSLPGPLSDQARHARLTRSPFYAGCPRRPAPPRLCRSPRYWRIAIISASSEAACFFMKSSPTCANVDLVL